MPDAAVGHAAPNDHRAGAALMQKLLVARVGKKTNFTRARLFEGSNFVNDHTAVPDHRPSNMIGKFDKRFTDGHLPFCPAVVHLDHSARDIRALIAVKNLRAFENHGELFRLAEIPHHGF